MSTTNFATTDFPLAASLISVGYKLRVIDRQPTGRAEFIFDRSASLDTTIQAFWCGDLRIEPKLFFANQKMLKSQLYS